ncbi:hypothetical protein HDU96_004638 [Phlyctochytrium bullatum]|nr:hypothetical protein HDU96_004638 [Phlyctochytrium bullatum]
MGDVELTSFVSEYVRQSARDEAKRTRIEEAVEAGRPFCEREWAAVLMIDVSGFSALTTKLAVYGKISSELITNAICSYMTKIIHQVVQHGGDVTKFLGDALLVVFRSPPAAPPHLGVANAFRCALTIMRDFPYESVDTSVLRNKASGAERTEYRLGLHMALIAGEVGHAVVGGRTRMDYVVWGECFGELEGLLKSANAGEIAVSTEAWTHVSQAFQKTQTSLPPFHSIPHGFLITSAFFPKTPPPSKRPSAGEDDVGTLPGGIVRSVSAASRRDSKLRKPKSVCGCDKKERTFVAKFVNAAIVHQYQAVRDAENEAVAMDVLAGQYRHITIVFVKILSSFDEWIAQRAMMAFLQSLELYGGVFQQFSVDDKGSSMMAVFGVPPYTHEDQPARALKSVLHFLDNFKDTPCVGSVTTGTLLFTRLGSKARSEASFLGDVVNHAARFLSVASAAHPLVCDVGSASAVKGFTKGLLGRFSLKGCRELQEVWYVSGLVATSRETVAEAMVGYEEEKEKLRNQFAEWRWRGEETTVLMEGPSGIGKTSLLDWFLKEVESAGVTAQLTSFSKEKQLTPFSSIRSTFISLLQQELAWASGSVHTPRSRASSINTTSLFVRTKTLAPFLPAVDEVRRYLRNLGENEDFYPILHIFFQGAEFSDNEETRDMSSETRTALLIKIVSEVIARVSRRRQTVLVFDDLQNIDVLSLEVLLALSKVHSRAFLILSSRPIRDSNRKELQHVHKIPNLVHLSLVGLNDADIESIVLRSLGNADAVSVDGELLKSNSPLAILRTLDVLLDKNCLECNCGQIRLSMSALASNPEKIVENVVTTGIMIKFDNDMDESAAIHLINTHDTFAFLSPLETETSDSCYYFRHISIANAIYETLAFSVRDSMHIEAGSILERKITSENRSFILSQVYHHYSLTNSAPTKRIRFSEELGKEYLKNGFMSEALSIFQNLCDYTESLRDEIPDEFKRKTRVASWYSMLGQAAFANAAMDLTIASASKSLKILGAFCLLPSEFRKSHLYKELFRHVKLWWKTKGGKRPLQVSSDFKDLLERKAIIDLALVNFAVMYMYNDKTDRGYKILVGLALMNEALEVAGTTPVFWARRSMTFANGVLLVLTPWARSVFRSGRLAWDKCRVGDVAVALEYFLIIVYSTYPDLQELQSLVMEYRR